MGRGGGEGGGTGVVIVELVGPAGRVGPRPSRQRDAAGDDVHLCDEGAVHDQILLSFLVESESGSLFTRALSFREGLQLWLARLYSSPPS